MGKLSNAHHFNKAMKEKLSYSLCHHIPFSDFIDSSSTYSQAATSHALQCPFLVSFQNINEIIIQRQWFFYLLLYTSSLAGMCKCMEPKFMYASFFSYLSSRHIDHPWAQQKNPLLICLNCVIVNMGIGFLNEADLSTWALTIIKLAPAIHLRKRLFIMSPRFEGNSFFSFIKTNLVERKYWF